MNRTVLPFAYCTIVVLAFVLRSDKTAGTLPIASPSANERERTGAREALDFWTRSRAYPDNDIPADKYMKAYQLSEMKHKELSRTISSGSIWDPIGPINLAGRSLSVAVNAQ